MVIVVAAIVVLLLRRLGRLEAMLEPVRSELLALHTPSMVEEPMQRFDGPVVRLTFQESLDPQRFAEASRSSATESLRELLQDRLADGATLALQGLRLSRQGVEMIVSVSKGGRELLSDGRAVIPFHRASCSRLPLLTDARSGRVIEQLKEVPVSTVTARLATVSAAVVGAAHLIAGADLAKRLSHVESKLDLLLASRRIDQLARLERIYVSARELAFGGMDAVRQLEMWRLRGELRELRSSWRQDFRLKLERIEDPANAGWFQRTFTRQRSIDQRVRGGISEGEAEVALIEYSMRLEHVLAVGSGTLEEFLRSQDSELEQLDELRELLQRKAGYISGKHPDLAVSPVVDAVREVVAAHREMLPAPDPEPHTLVANPVDSAATSPGD